MTDDEVIRYSSVRFSQNNDNGDYIAYEDECRVRFTVTDEDSVQTPIDVKEMIQKFEAGLTTNILNTTPEEDEYGEGPKLSIVANPGTVNSLHAQLAQLFPEVTKGRDSSISVNSILSGISEVSFSSGSSTGISTTRQNHNKYLAPNNISKCSSPELEDEHPEYERKRLSSFSSNGGSPLFTRRRAPPVIRKKSIAENHKDFNGDTMWTYGVQQTDLQSVLNQRVRISSDSDESRNSYQENISRTESVESNETSDDTDSENANEDASSTVHSTDTLIEGDDDGGSSDDEHSTGSCSETGETAADNASLRSVGSFEMIPCQKYDDSITVSSDEFGTDINSVLNNNNEFLSVSAVNEWCASKIVEQPVESKKEKYRRRLTERVNELIRTEAVYVDKLRHVVEDYIPEMYRPDIPANIRGLKFEIFSNIERLYKFHSEEVLPAFRDARNDLYKLGQCFRNNEQKFHMYVIYSRNNKRSTRLVYENKDFFQTKQLELEQRLDLSSYLLEPVQRIPRYKLFLDDLVKTYQNYENERAETESRISKLSVDSSDTGGSNGDCSESGENALESLKIAKSMVENLLTTIDDVIALENIRDCPINLMNQGKLLKQDEFTVTDQSRKRHLMRVFLFEKVLLLTMAYRKHLTMEVFVYRDHIPMDEMGITSKENDRYKFSVWYKKRYMKNYKLEHGDPHVRADWVQEIMALLWKQAMDKKEMLLKSRSNRNSIVSVASQQSSDGSNSADSSRYNSLRGVPGEVKRLSKPTPIRRTTWYCE